MAISPLSAEPLNPRAGDALWTLWERMAAMFPGKWGRDNGPAPMKQDGQLTIAGETWLQVITGLRPSQIATGMAACMRESREWPPNAPRFLAMCHDIPSLSLVEQELGPGRDRCGFTTLVRSKLDLHVYATADGQHQARLARDAYERAVRHVLDGLPIPAAVPRLPAPLPTVEPVRDRDAAAGAMARAAAELGFGRVG